MARKKRKIGEILRGWGRISDKQLEEALKLAEASNKRIGQMLVELGYVSERDVAKALASQFDMEFVDLDKPGAINKEALQLIPRDVIHKYLVLPMGEVDGKLKLLVHDPNDYALQDDLRFRLGRELELALAARGQIKNYIEHSLSETQHSIDQITRDLSVDQSIDRGGSVDKGGSLDQSIDRGLSVDQTSIDRGLSIDQSGKKKSKDQMAAEDGPIIRLVDKMIVDAVRARASDIHVEPMEKCVRLRFRIDGVCHIRERLPKSAQNGIIARLKVLSGMKLDEKRVPLDGRIKMKVDNEILDFRVSLCPCYHGPSVVLRILRPGSALVGLPNLGMQPDTLEEFNKLITLPNGIFLVTGPTGSGKTTTLYTALNELNTPNKKIITAEDPVEFQFKGINQCQVDNQVGRSFANVLRAMLRQAPEIILVGEIRDQEVGEVAIQAALTGHLVFSTLHTNDAPSSITRLTDMGLKPFLVASSLQAVLAQRLVRVLCDKCKQPVENHDRKLLSQIGVDLEQAGRHDMYEAVGCDRCENVGYRGRKGIYELMVMDHTLREMAYKRATLQQIRKTARANGMRDLLGDGVLKALAGITSAEEVARVAKKEGVVEEATSQEEEDAHADQPEVVTS